ncbi:hypothetical protein F2Q69_00035458 [Brassica cretica]|uniref:Uncharacterized protein n=1 Tax=Brassica cretica TaxID=69181 RepID=A0A8S9SV67_BRACR|nr:hypothetical protein F2Q69_00035458 [Brassica cretica]
MMEKILKIQQKTSAYLNLRLDVLYKELNGKFETLDAHVMMLDAHVMMLDAQVSQTAEAVKKQEALVKRKAVESERHQVDAIPDNYFGEVLDQKKLEEDVLEYHMEFLETLGCIWSSKEAKSLQLLERPVQSDTARSLARNDPGATSSERHSQVAREETTRERPLAATCRALTAPMANAYRNAVVFNKIENLAAT